MSDKKNKVTMCAGDVEAEMEVSDEELASLIGKSPDDADNAEESGAKPDKGSQDNSEDKDGEESDDDDIDDDIDGLSQPDDAGDEEESDEDLADEDGEESDDDDIDDDIDGLSQPDDAGDEEESTENLKSRTVNEAKGTHTSPPGRTVPANKVATGKEQAVPVADRVGQKRFDSAIKSDGLSVTLTFETGRQKITLSELKTIKSGYTFVCTNPIQTPVEIRANGTLIGYGQLVDVEGKFGIQVVEFIEKC
jgi:flagellar motor switch/type III secretory pathway protein FliN